MKQIARLTMIFSILVLVSSNGWTKPTYIPVVNGLFTTGQWYFEGQRSSLGGNAQLNFIPALKFSEKFSLIPSIETKYLGTRSTEELAGGSNLFQDTWENAIGLKGVHKLAGGKWKVRERLGARVKFFRETTDEDLGDGLYDYRVFTIGAEVERLWGRNLTVALGYDYSLLMFPNYQSLESNQSQDLAREFAGEDVLDTNIQLASFRSKVPLPLNVQSQIQIFYSPRSYSDQHVVELSGLLTATKRQDTYAGATISFDRLFRTSAKTNLLANVSYGYTGLDSNQNHYDARLTEFVANFYDYDQQQVGTQLSLAYGKNAIGPMIFDVGASYSRRNYRGRTTQTVNGNYLNDKLYVIEKALNLGFSYPLSKVFRLKTTASFGRSTSNNDYEEVYRYNFNNANYQFGFTYDY